VLTLTNARALSASYFRQVVAPADPFWRYAGRLLPETALLVLYRGAFFYGTGRWAAWLIWAHVVHSYPIDLRWAGPSWAPMLSP
jgi:hypothetical protein